MPDQLPEFKDMGKREPAIVLEHRANGEILLTSPYEPAVPAQSIPHVLIASAQRQPDRALLAQRTGTGEWVALSYADAVAQCRSVAAGLLARKLGQQDAVAVLSARSFGHFVFAFGAMMAAVPVTPVSAPYSLLSTDHAKLKHIAGLLSPAVIVVDNLTDFQPALSALQQAGLISKTEIVSLAEETADQAFGCKVSSLSDWLTVTDDDAVDRSLAALSHETVARYMFTSGSTGMPKAVIYTQGQMCHSIAMPAGLNRPGSDSGDLVPPGSRVLEWMPWSHTGAGVMRLNSVIAGCGTIYFDTGRPVPGEYEETLRNMREVSPTVLSGAPVGYAMLADALEKDEALSRQVFGSISSLAFGSAAMAPSLYDRLQALSVKATGERIGITSSLASTEVTGVTQVYWPMENPGTIGLPIPGVQIKLVPVGDKLEIRVKGGSVTRGYYKDPEKTASAFDEEGFFCMGDAVRFVDPERPEAGLAFDGRVAEEFKLLTGTWVSAGTLRTQVAGCCSPWVRDAIICGLNEAFVAVMLWPNLNACRNLTDIAPAARDTADAAVLAAAAVKSGELVAHIRSALQSHNTLHTGSSTRIARFLLLEEPPSMDGNELTEKGYINQRATQLRRAAEVARLFVEAPDAGVHGV
ncbi:MAG: AMP-binding protein [Pseudomonadales bacterium]|nr:AMP-binding protein [Pseudomonadales bacterium]